MLSMQFLFDMLVVTNDLDLCQAWVSDNVTNDFQDGFIVDVEPNQKEGYVCLCDAVWFSFWFMF